MRVKCSIALMTILLLGDPTSANAQPETDDVSVRVLFVGNSYTAGIKQTLNQMLALSPFKDSTFEFITKNGVNLQTHLANPKTLEKIKTGRWDFVVLQDQSQIPALPGKYAASFHRSVDTFTKIIRDAGAEPVLYMTWGRRDGDPANKKLFPDYLTMQLRLYESYSTAAKRNDILLAPVGEAWATVRKADPALGRALYRNDGSHPSPKGAYLASSVLFRTLFHNAPTAAVAQNVLSADERQIIDNAVSNVADSAVDSVD